jgi:hypothetical protein
MYYLVLRYLSIQKTPHQTNSIYDNKYILLCLLNCDYIFQTLILNIASSIPYALYNINDKK